MLDKNEVRAIALKYAERVCQNYKPKQIIIFGSYVSGVPHEESDIDIAIIFDKVM